MGLRGWMPTAAAIETHRYPISLLINGAMIPHDAKIEDSHR